MATITMRQCNKCHKFKLANEVPKVQLFGKLYPIGSVMCLCETCRNLPLELGQRYITLGESKDG